MFSIGGRGEIVSRFKRLLHFRTSIQHKRFAILFRKSILANALEHVGDSTIQLIVYPVSQNILLVRVKVHFESLQLEEIEPRARAWIESVRNSDAEIAVGSGDVGGDGGP